MKIYNNKPGLVDNEQKVSDIFIDYINTEYIHGKSRDKLYIDIAVGFFFFSGFFYLMILIC